jgi:biotin/methionine sulfoxide reductase
MAAAQQSSHWGTFSADVHNGQIRVRPDPDDPAPSGLLRNIPAVDRARIDRPHVRRGWLEGGPGPDTRRGGDTFVPVNWDEVIPLLAGELRRVISSHGNEAIYGGSYGWASAGRFHHAQSQVHRFLNCLGGFTRSVQTYSLGVSRVLLGHVVGSDEPISRPTTWPMIVGHTELFVCFGGMPEKNAQVNPGGVSRHTLRENLVEAHRRGAEYVLFSPLRDDLVADLQAEWCPVRPGTDTAVMLALCHVLLVEGRYDHRFVERYCVGFDAFAEYLRGDPDGVPKSPQWAQEISGVSAELIGALARRMADRRTMITMSWSLQRARFGEQPIWAGVALAAMLGQIGLPGGGFGHSYGALAGAGNATTPYSVPSLRQETNGVRSFIPVARIADLLLNPGKQFDYDGRQWTYPDIRLVYWAGGNPFHHHQDLTRLRRAFSQPDTVVVHDPFWTASAKHADIVVPATTTLERDDIGCSRNDSSLVAMHRTMPPLGQSRDDYRIFSALARELGVEDSFTEGRDERAWLEHLYESWRSTLPAEHRPSEDFAEFWEKGRIPLLGGEEKHVLFDGFRADPDAHPLATPSGRIEIASETIAGFGLPDCPSHPTWLPPEDLHLHAGAGDYPLHLVANNPARRLHSQLDHGEFSQEAKIHGREPLRMHPDDIAEHGLHDAEVVLVRSARGSCLAGLRASENVARGVVQLSTGAWFDPPADPETGITCVHGNPNVLTSDIGSSRLTQGCTGQHARVRVERAPDPLPPLRAFDPPATDSERR